MYGYCTPITLPYFYSDELADSDDLRLMAGDPVSLVAVEHCDVSRRDAANILRMLVRRDARQVGGHDSNALRAILLGEANANVSAFREEEARIVCEFLRSVGRLDGSEDERCHVGSFRGRGS